MIPTLQLDPSTLSLWLNGELLGEHLGDLRGNDFVKAVASGSMTDANRILDDCNDPRLEAYYYQLASAVWHEKRHFVDFVMTNWGASQVRAFFQMGYNSTTVIRDLLAAGHREILCPIDVYDDPMQLAYAGVMNEVPESVRTVAKWLRRRKRAIRLEESFVVKKNHVGGRAQLESMAYLCQCASVQYYYGTNAIDLLNRFTPLGQVDDPLYLLLRHISPDLPQASAENLPTKNGTIGVALAFAALCGRVADAEPSTPIEMTSPAWRLALLASAEDWSKFASASDEEVWSQIDRAAKASFGRGIVEELLVDLTFQKKMLDVFEARAPGSDFVKALANYTDLRERMIRRFRDEPTAFTSVAGFFAIQDDLRPFEVLCARSGNTTPLKDHEVVFGFDFTSTVKDKSALGWYAAIDVSTAGTVSSPTEAARGVLSAMRGMQSRAKKAFLKQQPRERSFGQSATFSLDYREGWASVMSDFAPMAKLLMNGRRYRTMLGFELARTEAILQRLKLPARYMNGCSQPDDAVDAPAYGRFTRKERLKCDLTSEVIETDKAIFVSPWAVRENLAFRHRLRESIGNRNLADFLIDKDWSHWVMSDKTARGLQFL